MFLDYLWSSLKWAGLTNTQQKVNTFSPKGVYKTGGGQVEFPPKVSEERFEIVVNLSS